MSEIKCRDDLKIVQFKAPLGSKRQIVFDYYMKMQERIICFISANARISAKEVRQLMENKNQMADDIGTVLIGKQAVQAGIIDEVGGISEALTKLKQLCSKKT